MAARPGARPAMEAAWPCLQTHETAASDDVQRLHDMALSLEGVIAAPAPFDSPGWGFALTEALACGQPEAFISEPVWSLLRPDGTLHLSLRPEWAQKVVNKGWAVVHPFARYMAGAIPPQSLIVLAPRDDRECAVASRILQAAHGYAVGRIDGVILPDTRW